MKLHRIRLRDYRGVHDRDVSLAATGVTIVEGDNETGKSSLAEAIDRILKYPDSSKATEIQELQPVGADVGPEVEIEMSVGDYRFVYRKRWLRQPATTLTVEAPAREQLTGRAAHDRVEQILLAHADLALWEALRLQQGVNLAQATLGKSRSLMRALEAASGASSTGDEASDLLERIEAQYARYFTPGGQSNKAVRLAVDASVAARARVAGIEAELRALDVDVDRHARLQEDLRQAETRRAEQGRLVAALRAAERELDALRAEVDRCAGDLRVAELEADQARKEVVARADQVDAVKAQGATCAEVAGALAVAEGAIRAANRAREDRRRAVEAARRALSAAEARSAVATADLAYHRTRVARDQWRARHTAVVDALARRREAAEFLETCRIDEDLLRGIETKDQDVLTARALLAANRTAVRLTALAEQTLEIDGRDRALAAGEETEEQVAGTLELVVPGRVRLAVVAGASTQELGERLATAEQEHAQLLRLAGAPDVFGARALLQQRHAMTQTRREADDVLSTMLGDSTPEEVVALLDRHDAEIATYEAERAATSSRPTEVGAADAAGSADAGGASSDKAVDPGNVAATSAEARARAVAVADTGTCLDRAPTGAPVQADLFSSASDTPPPPAGAPEAAAVNAADGVGAEPERATTDGAPAVLGPEAEAVPDTDVLPVVGAEPESATTEDAPAVAGPEQEAVHPLPPDLDAADAVARSAEAAVTAARAELAAATAAFEAAGIGHIEAERALAGQSALRDQARQALAQVEASLQAARAAAPDAALDAELAARVSAARAAKTAHVEADRRLEARDPAAARASLANAEAVLDRLENEAARDAEELQRLQGRLEAVGERGLHDRLAESISAADRAARDADILERRARAVRLLREVMLRHREATRERYRAPLKAKIEELGRIVFGEDLSVELDADLRIVARTLAGTTLPYASLSTGAREQLCVVERLSCATLVSREGGAPVIFDDALGYSDPGRLRRLGAVLSIAGRDSQVILLTCMPDRYRQVGGATVVRLEV